MFTMMNEARLGVGVQGLAMSEVAYQNAAIYAKERLQGRALTGAKAKDKRPIRSSCIRCAPHADDHQVVQRGGARAGDVDRRSPPTCIIAPRTRRRARRPTTTWACSPR
jgi:alkylation response protein AidB-like acyl-CoA dehydrogenase